MLQPTDMAAASDGGPDRRNWQAALVIVAPRLAAGDRKSLRSTCSWLRRALNDCVTAAKVRDP